MKIKYNISRLHNDGGNYVVFLSHSNESNDYKDIIQQLNDNGITVASDKEILPGSLDFSVEIKNMIRAAEVSILLISNGKITPWMIYELGLAAGYGKKIFFFSKEAICENTNYFFKQYGPIITNINHLVHEVKNGFFFSALFEYETYGISKNTFLKACMSNIDICKLSFNIFGIEEIPRNYYRFGYILLSISRYEKLFNPNRLTNLCNMSAEDIIDGNCNIDGKKCSLCSKQSFDGPTDIILNKILYNCNVNIIHQSLSFTIPFNKQRGVTFKCFVDVLNIDYVQDIISLLNHAGLYDIGVSHSTFGNRVYFMLPQSVMDGLFAIEAPDGFINNYLCKGALL